MSKPSNPTLIGSFVLGAVALLVAATLLFGGAELFASKQVLVSYFPGSVKGLREGSNVTLNGVRIGYVKTIRLKGEFEPDKSMHMVSEVTMEVLPKSYELVSSGTTVTTEARTRLTTDQYAGAGLRAKLGMDSFVTGQLLVELIFQPDSPAVFRSRQEGGPAEIPTIPSDIQQAIERVQDFFANISRDVDFEKVGQNLEGIISGLNEIANSPDLRKTLAGTGRLADEDIPRLARTLERSLVELEGAAKETRSLVAHVDTQVDPLMTDLLPAVQRLDDTLKAAELVLREASGHLRDDSELAVEVRQTLQDLQSASNAATALLDYLGNHPEALMKGKKQ